MLDWAQLYVLYPLGPPSLQGAGPRFKPLPLCREVTPPWTHLPQMLLHSQSNCRVLSPLYVARIPSMIGGLTPAEFRSWCIWVPFCTPKTFVQVACRCLCAGGLPKSLQPQSPPLSSPVDVAARATCQHWGETASGGHGLPVYKFNRPHSFGPATGPPAVA